MTQYETSPKASGKAEGKIAFMLHHPMLPYFGIAGAVSALLVGGIFMVFSASSVFSMQVNNGTPYELALKQALFGGAGALLMWWVSHWDINRFRRFAGLALVGSVFILILVLFIGESVYGQKNWIPLVAGFKVQPSEFAKLGLVIWSADHLAKRYGELHYWRRLLWPLGGVFILFVGLVGAEGDFGTAMIMSPIVIAMWFFVGIPIRWFVAPVVLGLTVVAFATIGSPYRRARFSSWFHPEQDMQNTGFQVMHGRYALGTGSWNGVGIGASRQKWGTLPQPHTDFIYAVIGEEMGLLGTGAVIVLFVIIAYCAFRIAHNTSEPFIQLATLGVMAWIMTQMLVNVGAVLSILPITGVPIPLVSYGGSSLIPTLAAFGMLLAFARHESREAQVEGQEATSQ